MKKLILVLVVVLLSNFNINAFAQNNGISLFFANGMFNDYTKAEKYLNTLKKKLKTELPNDTDIKFFLSYNQQELENLTGIPAIDWVATGIGQLFTVTVQQRIDILDSFWNMMAGTEIAPDWFQEKMKELSSSVNELLYVVDEDLQNHIEKYEEEIEKGRKIIIVSQSQGNFYANSAYGYMSPENLTIVAVGSPASFVAGDGEYTTLTNDIIVNAIRITNPLTLSANVTNSTSSEWTNHSFVKSYLNGDVSGPRIIKHILDEIKSDEEIGSNWTQAITLTPWSTAHTSVVFDGKMWVLDKNGTWCSSDGIDWTEATSSAPWGARKNNTLIVFDGKMWIMGGIRELDSRNDVWCSSDGIDWTEVIASAPWDARHGHTSVVFDGKMWIMGGCWQLKINNIYNFGARNDVWCSSDGIDWTEATSSAPWGARAMHTSVVFDGKMWVMGGFKDGQYLPKKNDVWCSSDGIDWTEVIASAPWDARYGHSSIVFDEKMWIIGGGNYGGLEWEDNDVWYSSDGIDWIQAIASAPWDTSFSHTSVVFNGKMWFLNADDVWYSSD